MTNLCCYWRKVAATAHSDLLARRKLGRPIPQVLLLHANALVADYLEVLLTELDERGVVYVMRACLQTNGTNVASGQANVLPVIFILRGAHHREATLLLVNWFRR